MIKRRSKRTLAVQQRIQRKIENSDVVMSKIINSVETGLGPVKKSFPLKKRWVKESVSEEEEEEKFMEKGRVLIFFNNFELGLFFIHCKKKLNHFFLLPDRVTLVDFIELDQILNVNEKYKDLLMIRINGFKDRQNMKKLLKKVSGEMIAPVIKTKEFMICILPFSEKIMGQFQNIPSDMNMDDIFFAFLIRKYLKMVQKETKIDKTPEKIKTEDEFSAEEIEFDERLSKSPIGKIKIPKKRNSLTIKTEKEEFTNDVPLPKEEVMNMIKQSPIGTVPQQNLIGQNGMYQNQMQRNIGNPIGLMGKQITPGMLPDPYGVQGSMGNVNMNTVTGEGVPIGMNKINPVQRAPLKPANIPLPDQFKVKNIQNTGQYQRPIGMNLNVMGNMQKKPPIRTPDIPLPDDPPPMRSPNTLDPYGIVPPFGVQRLGVPGRLVPPENRNFANPMNLGRKNTQVHSPNRGRVLGNGDRIPIPVKSPIKVMDKKNGNLNIPPHVMQRGVNNKLPPRGNPLMGGMSIQQITMSNNNMIPGNRNINMAQIQPPIPLQPNSMKRGGDQRRVQMDQRRVIPFQNNQRNMYQNGRRVSYSPKNSRDRNADRRESHGHTHKDRDRNQERERSRDRDRRDRYKDERRRYDRDRESERRYSPNRSSRRDRYSSERERRSHRRSSERRSERSDHRRRDRYDY